jgi:REP element-mobilizing transposase RayT
MPYDQNRHHRHSIRLKVYDYVSMGAYYVTICAAQRGSVFGRSVGGKMRLNAIGRLVHATWLSVPEHHPHVALDAFVVMPDHVHGIIVFIDRGGATGDGDACRDSHCGHCVGVEHARPLRNAGGDVDATDEGDVRDGGGNAHNVYDKNAHNPNGAAIVTAARHTPHVVAGSLGAVVRAFKSAATREVNLYRRTPGAALWQRNYYDHIVRDEADLARIRRYIAANPACEER